MWDLQCSYEVFDDVLRQVRLWHIITTNHYLTKVYCATQACLEMLLVMLTTFYTWSKVESYITH